VAILGIDHVIVIAEELDDLVRRYRELGFTVTAGGDHAGGQTHNALIPFADGSYIELLAFLGSKRASRRAAPRGRHPLTHGSGLIEYMLTSSAIDFDIASARRHRLPYNTPVAGSRTRPDGVEVAWLDGPLTEPRSGLPTLIQDVTPRELRVPPGAAREHANGVTGIAAISVAVSSIDSAALLYQRLLDDDAETARLTRAFVEAVFRAGPHRIVLLQPLDFGPLDRHVRDFGDSPFALELIGPEPHEFDPAETGGVRLSITGPQSSTL
jgi:hypothetical protein